ncbi:M20/M25/M40 family metallo-hydrolase [Natronogracilivirga saccharolytica]|uniref:M20/M25/M40 family metallo-hydrolase n=1 Tax=Natronogracilivirga saccharolytica TaxID=2812953 RepID=A0A8J7RRI6_9BACT|nr:M20/M25/M40 family metallo-hydrolase [Natronogracilivirga saccharolytica]MBP3191637.1 M20/M25/M40 family metallo-hydrolase [Natronogracilivirga saccharolytica]
MQKITDIPVTELLFELIRFPSLSTQEADLADWLEEKVSETGLFQTERHGDNLIFHLGSGRPWLLLNSHSDVVPPSARHAGAPFEPVLKNGRIYGRGSTDAKGSVSCMLMALMNLARSGYEPPGRVSFALTVCEESAGHNNGMAFLRSKINKPDAALVGEPTLLHPCAAQKGLLILKLDAEGEAGHAARVSGPNAIYEMSSALEKLKTIRFQEENPFIGSTRITPTTIEGGTAKNAHPDSCSVFLDIRTIPEVPNDLIIDRLRADLEVSVSVYSDRFVSTSTDPGHPVARAAKDVTGFDFFGSPTTSDWVFLADVPTIKIGPGDSRDSHTANESIDVHQLEAGVPAYENIIRGYFELIESQQERTNADMK